MLLCASLPVLATPAPGVPAQATPQQTGLRDWPVSHLHVLPLVRNRPQLAVDTLQNLLTDEDDPILRAAYYALLSRAYSALTLPRKALDVADKGRELVRLQDQPWLYYQLALSRAEALDSDGRPSEGKTLTGPALRWAEAHQAWDLLAYGLSIDGYLSLTLSATDDALASFQQGYSLAQQRGTRIKPEDFASMIALVYEYRQEPELALPFLQEAEAYYRENDIQLELANTLFGMGKANIDLGNRESGLRQLRDSAQIALNIGDLQGAAYSYHLMARQLINQEKYAQAEDFLNEALTIFEDANNRFMQINVLLTLHDIALHDARFESALQQLQRAESLARGDAFLPSRITINDRKAALLARQGKYLQAYQHLKDNVALQEQLNKEQNSQRLFELRTRFEVEQQHIQNALLKEQNLRQQAQLQSEQTLQRYIFVVVFLLLVICLLLASLYINGKHQRQRLEKLANEDELTGLMSRRKMLEQLDHHLLLAQRHKLPLTVAVIDLDHFKRINDQFGHLTGDAVLREFGALARQSFRTTDLLGRIGGEEFMFCFMHTDTDEAQAMLTRFATRVKDIPFALNVPGLKVSVSAGVAAGKAYSVSTIIAHADDALYQAKHAGRDRIVIYPQ
ncbi:sensor domain-containing diguanylate cyclase [Alteromonas sp. CYL-A6]|uniref:sensor domain-containing diguanylate cyclase n=1 Tax=Alteromonas nitratireducens TaxID=3390813 RepID=UPI0034AA170E